MDQYQWERYLFDLPHELWDAVVLEWDKPIAEDETRTVVRYKLEDGKGSVLCKISRETPHNIANFTVHSLRFIITAEGYVNFDWMWDDDGLPVALMETPVKIEQEAV